MTANNPRAPCYLLCLAASALIAACSSAPESGNSATLADIDVALTQRRQAGAGVEKKSREEVRKAYRTYVEGAATHDSSRQKALTRLAQLELELSHSLARDGDKPETQSPAASESLKRTIALLETTLRDYPQAKGNDKVLYQLAQAYDRAGRYQDSIAALGKLVAGHPRSLHYSEAQFRLAESAFARGNYINAEDAYTEVLLSPGSDKYYEKSLFKRGWTRYKQQLYLEAIDDYVDAIDTHQFADYQRLSDADKTQFDEYFRALGLAFSHQRGQLSIAEYFARRPSFNYLYQTYAVVGDIYLQQERFSDAATVLEEYTRAHRFAKHTPLAEQKIIAAWRQGGFTTRLNAAIERFYQNYRPDAEFWRRVEDEATYQAAHENLRGYITQVSSYYHNRYQKRRKREDYRRAGDWYQRYLRHYTAYANQDNMYALYAELLLDGGEREQALQYFTRAAYDGDIILDKKAAYATIVLSAELIDASAGQAALAKHLDYAQRYVDLYPRDKRSDAIAISAAERAFAAKRHHEAIELANFIPDDASEKTRFNANNLKARAYLELREYADAEAVYRELLDSRLTSRKVAGTLNSSLALAIYRQGEAAKQNGQMEMALSHFTRIARVAPNSKLAATGLYDAIAMSMAAASWNRAIVLIEEFKARYPQHRLLGDVSKKLSVAYLNSDQKGKAAREFERIAEIEGDLEVKKAALWQAAELYESKRDMPAAIRAYRDYAHTYKTPYAQNMEAMYKLAELYRGAGDTQKRYFWQTRIRRADQRATKRAKTERTTYIASTTTLDLARQKQNEFKRRRLVAPLAKNLRRKKEAMQASVKLFGLASSYGIEDITTEATTAIGDIYYAFSKALLDSERPRNLSGDELEQYEILLEDQAFPFEEKAIEFYETNLARTRDGIFNPAVQASFSQLVNLFPVRYQRKGRVDVFED